MGNITQYFPDTALLYPHLAISEQSVAGFYFDPNEGSLEGSGIYFGTWPGYCFKHVSLHLLIALPDLM